MEPAVQTILLKLPVHKLQLADTLRGIICSADKSIKEKVKWGRITFSTINDDIAFLCCKAENEFVELGFFKATSLNDPYNLFEGKGKDTRRIKIYSLDKLPAEQVKQWVKQAVSLDNN